MAGNRVAWREGMFLRPQHFQAQDRFVEGFVAARHDQALPYSWGFSQISLDLGLAELGQVAIASARGVMPDGTPFSIPEDMPPPKPLAIADDTRDSIVYLTLPTRQRGAVEFADVESGAVDTRFLVEEHEISDNFSEERASEDIALGRPNLRLGMTPDETEGRLLVGLARIREVSSKKVVFDDRFIPPAIDLRAGRLASLNKDIMGRAEQLASSLARTAADSAEGGQDTFRAFLLLQALNRWTAVLKHLDTMPAIHPERLFENFLALAAEASTLKRSDRKPPPLPTYKHEDLQGCFDPLVNLLQDLLSGSLEQSTEMLQLGKVGKSNSSFQHIIRDRELVKNSYLYLAVSDRSKSLEEIRKRIPAYTKIGSTLKMREMVQSNLESRIPLRHTTTPPSQLRILPNYVYFELDRSSPHWPELYDAPGIGFHIADEWPELKLELWAVKQKP
ncbi:type VI secretion system baseplate subunit TssK [Aurantiacibacter zhengii]|uniref:Type VI secretion system baseplate subunit TssK n=1 Tax=Aurantiacibacter zhengii TaxID=2307003 RepID=A0A418NN15_9SPHN|nr:type VI secretion system baseplate subunit TssK [Aurantiacibacter zhengii]RIV82871.1 type VI secretion system baseplate subunit TssK [Aurantiacibacter zhengii]